MSRVVHAVAVFSVLVLATGCRPSAPSESGWRSSSEQAVTDMISDVATARITVRHAQLGHFVGRYAVVALTYAEEEAGKASDQVTTLQPPMTERASYQGITGSLGAAQDAITQARIAVTDDDTKESTAALAALDQSLRKLQRIEDQLRAGR